MRKLGKDSLIAQLRDFGIGPILGMLISFVTVPITTRILVPEEFAKTSMYSLCQTVFYLVCLLGCDQSYVRFYNENKVNKKSLFFNSAIFPSFFCLISAIIIGFLWHKISIFLFDQEEPIIMLMIIVSIPFSVIARFSDLKIRMDMRGKAYSFITLFKQVISFVLLVIFLFFYEKSFRAIILSAFFAELGHCVISLIISKLFIEKDTVVLDWQLIKNLLKYGVPLLFASILSWLMNSFDKIALRTWSTFEEIGLYTAAFKIVSLIMVIQNIFTTAWTPVAYKWYEQNEKKEKFFEVANAMMGFLLIVFSLIIVFRKLILLYLGPEYRNTSEIFVFLLFSPVLYIISSTTSLGIEFKKKSIFTTIVSVIVAIINILGNWLLVPFLGALGASITTALSYVIFVWLRTIISNRIWEKYSLIKLLIITIIMVLFGINMITIKSIVLELCLFILSLVYSIIININLIKRLCFKKVD